MTSLLEMIDARIAELKQEQDDIYQGEGIFNFWKHTIDELEQVRQKVVEIAQKLEEKEREYELAYKLESIPDLKSNYLGRKLTYGHALSYIGQPKQIEVNSK